ncbi:ABC transporter ATP-binding protein [Prauserella muralis]|uniref:Peptide ABC transporter substrate-binding protein n=1 Tax=Prauserella muralis TaxID=588067 RepID=A0A2V4ARR0_9PSEU|nr:oligopeptide/dipeptide ABC transporter ATP-binding protein [Prauserella muralis]PXY22714.1 peptide ABC transporter substrate-binding protein [Prauserella muralis]TWE28433.1 peptide/nickel transport system ATP-binding protein/oligopeptide transport system ATP-binding protein [Prauserella muralis]
MSAEPTVETGQETPILEVRDLVKHYPVRRGAFGRGAGVVRAVDGVSFRIPRGRTVGLVGESGSGKSTTARLANRLVEPTSGQVLFDGADLLATRGRELKALRSRMQMVFQDPYGSLNPRMTVFDIVGEPLEVHGVSRGRARTARVTELLETVGLSGRDLYRFPHQFSGGQAQRIGIARALATNPDVIFCDESVSALDVSVQAQILNLLKRLQRELGLSYLFIAHDLNVVRYMADELCVMYMGEIVERGDSDAVFADPRHPYTQLLLAAIPGHDPATAKAKDRAVARGEVPSPSAPPSGCRFHTRCPFAFERCTAEAPRLRTSPATGRAAACHLLDDTSEGGPS